MPPDILRHTASNTVHAAAFVGGIVLMPTVLNGWLVSPEIRITDNLGLLIVGAGDAFGQAPPAGEGQAERLNINRHVEDNVDDGVES